MASVTEALDVIYCEVCLYFGVDIKDKTQKHRIPEKRYYFIWLSDYFINTSDLRSEYSKKLYAKVREEKREKKESLLIYKDSEEDIYPIGEVISIGNGVTNCKVGDRIYFNKKSNDIIDGCLFVHNSWIEDIVYDVEITK